MAVFDMDSHLREEYFLDEVYRLEGKFAHLTPVRLSQDRSVRARMKHDRSPWPREVAEHFDHSAVASDYPHFDSEHPGTVRELMGRTDISQRQKDKITSGNAREFLHL